ncbi:MAG: adenylosuccinate lyase [Candidatus Doudnabacteria bacterium]|nr:adenylosuccinate lyase [Candidatus Doudnabacteria bacterium]
MIKRYTREPMGEIWSDDQRFRYWVLVETEAMRARAELGEIEVTVPENLGDRIKIDAAAIELLEVGTPEKPGNGHDVVSFLEYTSPQLPEELRPHWHGKMTSMDPGDTSLMMQLVASLKLIMAGVSGLMDMLKKRAFEHKYTPMIGRTHIVHAEPITFGVKLANWYDEMIRHTERMEQLMDRLAVGKLSGAVGMYTLDPKVEQIVCRRLGLSPVIATQVISRDIIAEYMTVLGLIAGSIRKFATTSRLMQQTEVRELQEPFRKGQKGSSAMPHKRNPVGGENISGLTHVIQAFVQVAFANQVTWHERDISNSGPERIILPDASILMDYILARFTKIVAGWSVFPERMAANLNLTKGLVYSQEVQALIAEKSGLPRQQAYGLVYEIAQRCWETGEDFQKALINTGEIRERISEAEIIGCFDLKEKIKHVDYIFSQVFGGE